jgi:hypothetical protein
MTRHGWAEPGTTFEASCYTDPLAMEHLTGSLSATIAHVGTHDWSAPVGLRFTTKFDDVAPLLAVPHGGRTRVRKFGKYGSTKYVYPKDVMTGLRAWFESALAEVLPQGRLLYWT